MLLRINGNEKKQERNEDGNKEKCGKDTRKGGLIKKGPGHRQSRRKAENQR